MSRLKQQLRWLAAAVLGMVAITYWLEISWASSQPQQQVAIDFTLKSSPPPPPPPQTRKPPPPSSNPNAKIIDVFFYEIIDSKFNLTHSGLSSEEIDSLCDEITEIWSTATEGNIYLRFHRREQYLTPNQQLAHLFFVFGHPRIAPNRKQTHLSVPTDWVTSMYSRQIGECELGLQFLTKQQFPSLQFPLDRTQFESKFPAAAAAAFPCLVGDNSNLAVITKESWEDFLFARAKPIAVQRTHIAFRLFYLEAGLSVQRTKEFIEVMRDKPLLFLHYAIGRDMEQQLGGFKVNRTEWEFSNTFSVYPVPYYHDMNGRGSTNWMDVLFRTSSCFEDRIKLNWRDTKIPVQCRWGTRKWERHVYKLCELARMVAHEIGHCLGLEHFEPRCQVFPSIESANLMQQQRVLALQSWSEKCTCMSSTCGDCGCVLDEETFHQVSLARALTPDQIALAFKSAERRQHLP